MKETNMEHYRKELEELCQESLGFTLKDNEIKKCNEIRCNSCDFYNEKSCRSAVIKWLMAEYEPPKPKLTKREKILCEFLETGYIARDLDSVLWCYNIKPNKTEYEWARIGEKHLQTVNLSRYNGFGSLKELFHFIKWEDSEPWAVEDLLKLEVIG
jgi:hypothetical protein